MPEPANLTIICPTCPPQNPARPLSITLEDVSAYCPLCRRRFRLITREISSVRTVRLDPQSSRYEVMTSEGGSRKRLRRLIAPSGVHFQPQHWITLVYRGEHLLGIAEQTTSYWYPVPLLKNKHVQHSHLLLVLSTVCLLLAALQLHRLVPALEKAGTHSGVTALIAATLFLCAPALLWALQTGWSSRTRTYLPPTTSGWND